MEQDIKDAIKALAVKAPTRPGNEAMHYAQAALNLAHVLQVLKHVK